SAIGGSNRERSAAGLKWGIQDKAKSQLIQIESPTSLAVANEHGNRAEAEIGINAVRLKTARASKHGRRVSGSHRASITYEPRFGHSRQRSGIANGLALRDAVDDWMGDPLGGQER